VMYLTCQAVNRIPAEIYGRPPAISGRLERS